MKRLALAVLLLATLTGCASQADVASDNVSTAADNFEVNRRIIFYDPINGYGGAGAYLLVIEGLCSLGNYDDTGELSVTCKVGPSQFKKHFLGLSDNVTYFVEHLEPTTADPFHYRIIFRPETIIPDIEVQTSG